MSMAYEPARVSIAAGATAETCELCTAETANTTIPRSSVVVSHPRGGIVQLAACDWCVQAIRRLAAASGGQAMFALSEAAGPPPSVLRAPLASRPAYPPVLILELSQQIQDAAGITYVVRVFGRGRADGTWEGWIEFVAVGAGLVRRTPRETTQSSREDLAYWATGLEATYLEGAFARSAVGLPATPAK